MGLGRGIPAIIKREVGDLFCLVSEHTGSCLCTYFEADEFIDRISIINFHPGTLYAAIKSLEEGEGIECRLLANIEEWSDEERKKYNEIRPDKVCSLKELIARIKP